MSNVKAIASLLMVILASQPFCAATQTAEQKQATIKEQVAGIPIGSAIEVKLLQEGSNKVKGKLMSVASESFEVQTAQSGKVANEQMAFADVKSVKKSGMRRLYKILIIVGVVWVGLGIVVSVTLQ